jgi:hypothetical protein
MAAPNADRDAYVSEDPSCISCDSGYVTGDSATEEDCNVDANAHAHPSGFAATTHGNEQTSRSISRSRMVERTRILSRIPVYFRRIQTRSTTTPSNELYDRAISDVRRALSHPMLSSSSQIAYNGILNALFALRDAAHIPLPLQEIVPCDNCRPVYGPQPRPLGEAAIRQNARARTRRAYTTTLKHIRYQFPHAPDYAALPIRYSHPYDDLLGSRSLDDGTAAAYAERDGEMATYALRFCKARHNGYLFGKGRLHITTEDKSLVEARQSRTLAGLSTQDLDDEITHRVQQDPDSWGTSKFLLTVENALTWYAKIQVGSANMYAKLSGPRLTLTNNLKLFVAAIRKYSDGHTRKTLVMDVVKTKSNCHSSKISTMPHMRF